MTFRPVAADRIESEVSAGDTLRVTSHAGTVREFDVTAIEDGNVLGADTAIPVGQISKLEKLEPNWLGNIGIGSAAILVAVVLVTMTIF